MRYAKAMTVAADPAAERKEYYKKLYKLISPPEGDPALNLFAQFAAGEISSTDLKRSWAEKQLEAEPKGDWVLYDSYGKRVQGQTYNGYSKTEAWEQAKQKLSPGGSMEGFQRQYKLLPSNSETGDWEVYNTETGETLETLRGYETRGAAADAVYDKYVTDQGIPFNLRPVDPEAPEKPLTQREKLAKNIKAQGPAPKTYYKWNIDNPKTGETNEEYMTRERVFQTTRKAEKDNPKDGKYTNTIVGKGSVQVKSSEELRDIDEMSFDFREAGSSEVIEHKRFSRATDSVQSYTSPVVVAIERANELSEELGKPVVAYEVPAKADKDDNSNDVASVKRKWEFYYSGTGRVLDTVDDINMMQANAVLADVQRRYDDLPADQIRMRSVPTEASAERARARNNNVQDTDIDVAQNFSKPPEGFMTKPPATGSYYEIKSNNKIYGYVPSIVAANVQREIQREVNQYIEELTGRDDAQWIRRQGPPEGFQTQRPETGDYYEVRGSNNRVYGYITGEDGRGNNSNDIARNSKSYVDELTGADGAYIQYRAGDPVQATAPNGVPLWEVYERDSGHVVHTFADHDQTSAWATAQTWLRDIGAEDPSLFSCKPKMSA
jgi:hypothetical protein